MKLSERMREFRSDRPDEWTMDDFIREAEKLESALQKAYDMAWDLDPYGVIETDSRYKEVSEAVDKL